MDVEHEQQQIPFGNDNKKSKGASRFAEGNDNETIKGQRRGSVQAHPSQVREGWGTHILAGVVMAGSAEGNEYKKAEGGSCFRTNLVIHRFCVRE
jgi:hypothetical protein